MHWEAIPVMTAVIPLAWTWWTHRRTPLVHALTWGAAAWVAWVAEAAVQTAPYRYAAVALTACTGVAVLGARRPGAGAWNAVVAGLLAVLLLPIARKLFLTGEYPIDSVWLWFLGIVVGVACLNYLGSRLRWPAGIAFIACLMHIGYINNPPAPKDEGVIEIIGALVPWMAWLGLFRRDRTSNDGLWLGFRDRFGAVWATRVIMQFNSAAKNSGLKVHLRMDRFHGDDQRPISDAEEAKARTLLLSLLQRFGWP